MTSESVCPLNLCPLACSSRLKSCAFVRQPLWTRAIFPEESWWGWALVSVFPPCVAQRVWAMPITWPELLKEWALTRSMQSALSLSLLANLVTTWSFQHCEYKLWRIQATRLKEIKIVVFYITASLLTIDPPVAGMVAIPALSYPRFFKAVSPSNKKSLESWSATEEVPTTAAIPQQSVLVCCW